MVNVCPMCQVTDVTIRYNTISHVAAGFQIANPVVGYNGAGYIGALAGERYSIHDVLVDDINGAKYLGPSLFAQITSATGAPLLNNVSIDHVTAFAPKTMLIIGNRAGAPKIPHLTVTNSIFNAGPYPIWSSGGTTNCAAADVPLTTFNACFSPYFFSGNVVFAPSAIYPPAAWPSGNYFPSTVTAVGFVNYNNGIGGNYQLTSASPYRAKSPSGKNIGADIAAINQLTINVY